MRQWDIFMFPFSKERRHPAVIISNDETCQNPDIEEVNALLCTSAKVNRSAKSTEEVLDEADGLDWKTMVRCDKIHLLPKARFNDQKGPGHRRTPAPDRPENGGSVAAAPSPPVAR